MMARTAVVMMRMRRLRTVFSTLHVAFFQFLRFGQIIWLAHR